jgi:SAM-dependent methyltransferase
MNLKTLIAALRAYDPLTVLRLARDVQTVIRWQFLYAAIGSGLLAVLKTPSTKDDLVQKLDAQRPELLEALLNVGLSVGELSCRNGVYRVKGKRSLAVTGEKGDPLAAFIQVSLNHHNSSYLNLASRMHGAPSDNRLDEIGDTVARASKIYAPFFQSFVSDTVAGKGALRILDIGCGSGIYLHDAYEANSSVSGIGIDMDQAVVEQARRNLAGWGIGDRFTIIDGDIRVPPAGLSGSFDLITMYNVIYYFKTEERPGLLRSIQSMLSPGGRIALATNVRGEPKDFSSSHFNLVTSSIAGCTPLPTLGEVTSLLRDCGFEQIKVTRLIPGIALYGILATAKASPSTAAGPL